MFSHFCPHLPGTQRLKRLRAARCGASESCKYYSSFPCPLLLLLWARDVEIPIITTKPSLCHLDDSPHMAKILFAVLSAEQWSPHPVNLLVLTGNRYVQNKSVPVASSHVGRGVNPCFAGGWRATVAQGNRTPMNAESYPRWTGAGVQEA